MYKRQTESIAAVSSEEAVLSARRALDKAGSGYLDVYRYRVSETDDGTLVVFLDASTQLSTARQFFIISSSVAAGVCLAVLLLALLFSGRAVRPIAQSVEKQRQFITDAGHELKTPLTIISANCEVLEMEMAGNEWLTGIEKQVARLRKLVNDLVTLSRLDEGRPTGEEARFSLSDAVCDTALAFSAAAERAGKRLRADAEPGVFINGDEAALRQLTAILVDNAVKYADAGGEIRVGLRGGRHPVLTVENDCRNVSELPLDRLSTASTASTPPAPATAATASDSPSPAPSPRPTALPSAPKSWPRGGCACACDCAKQRRPVGTPMCIRDRCGPRR